MEKTVSWSAFWGYLHYIWKEKKILFLYGVFFFPAFITVNFLQVYLPKMIIMDLEDNRTIYYMGTRVLGLIALMLVAILVREKMNAQLEHGNRQVEQKVKCDYAKKLLYVDYEFTEDKKFLAMRNKVKESLFGEGIGGQDRPRLMNFMPELVVCITAAGNAVLYLYYLSKISAWLVLLLFVVIFIGTVVNTSFFRKNEEKYGQRSANTWQKLDYVTRKAEDFTMAKDIRLYQMNDWLTGWINTYLKERLLYKRKELTARGLGDAVYMLTVGIFMLSLLSMVLVCFWDGQCDVSDVVFYVNMGPMLYTLLDQDVSTRCLRLVRVVTEYQRFQNFMEYGVDTGELDTPVHKEAPTIVLEHVSFAYPGVESVVLKDINLRVQAGERVAIVGINGAGKTTLMKLICGLLHPVHGRILLNGVDMETMEAEERYAWFSCTFQDVQFLPVSIRENITQEMLEKEDVRNGEPVPVKKKNLRELLSESWKRDERIWNCLKQAGIKKEIEELPKKLDTLLEKNLNEDAVDFSGGQRQKLILARALYRDAGTLILDEPTAALDALAESEIYERYADFAREKTSFFVSHRLASTRFCDRILLLDGGKIAEQGTHDELLAEGGLYAKMFELQSKYYSEEV